jgi:hypothetical protein
MLKGAFWYVAGREVTFPPRQRAVRALSAGFYSPVICGTEVAKTVVALDNLKGVDLFPIAVEAIHSGMLDHIDWLVLPDGVASRYSSLKGEKAFINAYLSRGGRMVGWGAGAKNLPKDGKVCANGADVVSFLEAEAAK